MQDTVLVVLFENKKNKKGHLLYVLNDFIILNVDNKKLNITTNKNIVNILLNIYNNKKNFKDLEIVDMIRINMNKIKSKYSFYMKPNIFNCISLGKNILGVRGLYFSCNSFFNKLKRSFQWVEIQESGLVL